MMNCDILVVLVVTLDFWGEEVLFFFSFLVRFERTE